MKRVLIIMPLSIACVAVWVPHWSVVPSQVAPTPYVGRSNAPGALVNGLNCASRVS